MFLTNFTFNGLSRTFGNVYQHPDLVQMMPTYVRIRDCLNNRVKAKGQVYLPDPSELREDPKIREVRYAKYHSRAVFVPVTKRTQQGLVGQVFVRKPRVEQGNLPDTLINCIGVQGHNLEAFANYALREIVAMGRGAIVVGAGSRQQPMLDFIEAENILTWTELPYGIVDDLGRNMGSILLRTYTSVMSKDGITPEQVALLIQYRLDNRGLAFVRFLSSVDGETNQNWTGWTPCIIRGEHLKHIPVYIVGAESNTLHVDSAPLDELSALNISHYINSADYEEHVYVAGQVTVTISGLEQRWYDANIKGKVGFGVRAPLPLPKDAKAELLQAQPNSTAKEALDKKEEMMVSVGARLIEQRQVRRTATESNIEAESYHSILGHIANNVASALTQALVLIGKYYGEGYEKNAIALNTEFGIISTSAEHRRLCIEEWQQGIRSRKEARSVLRMYDDTLDDDDKSLKDIEAELPFREKVANVGKPPAVAGADNRTKPSQPKAKTE